MTDLTKQLCVDAIDNPDGLYCEGDFPPKATRTHLENYYRAVDNPQRVLELLERIEVLEKLLRMINSYAVIHIVGKHPEVSIPASYLEDIEEALNGGRG